MARSARCGIPNCDGAHINEGLCHFGDGPHKAKGLCKSCYQRAHRVYSQRRLPAFHVLTPEAVREIRRMYATGNFSQKELAQRFGVSGKSVCHIVHRKTWANVE